jgi:hypothetical protein
VFDAPRTGPAELFDGADEGGDIEGAGPTDQTVVESVGQAVPFGGRMAVVEFDTDQVFQRQQFWDGAIRGAAALGVPDVEDQSAVRVGDVGDEPDGFLGGLDVAERGVLKPDAGAGFSGGAGQLVEACAELVVAGGGAVVVGANLDVVYAENRYGVQEIPADLIGGLTTFPLVHQSLIHSS